MLIKKYFKPIKQLHFLFLISFFSSVAIAQSHIEPKESLLLEAERRIIVERISSQVIENYVFPEIAKQSAAFIEKQLESGEYQKITDAKEFATKLTQDLQSINHDKHMIVRAGNPKMMRRVKGNPALARLQRERMDQENNYGVGKLEHFEGNVGYLNLWSFMSAGHKAENKFAAALEYLSSADAIIVDLRENRGGSGDMAQFIASYFLPEKTQLNSVYWRENDRMMESWTLNKVPGKRLLNVPLFVLTSDITFSVAEAFSYDLKTRKRATFVGEVTGGGANPGGSFEINERFSIFISTGRAINPVTKTNWEGIGVKPDVNVKAEQAFEKALELAKIAAKEFKQKELEIKLALYKTLENSLSNIEEILVTGDDNRNVQALVNQALKKAQNEELLDESSINNLGYDYLVRQKNPSMAIFVLTYNTLAFPQSANTYDSLGEAYLTLGNKELSEENYTISKQLNLKSD